MTGSVAGSPRLDEIRDVARVGFLRGLVTRMGELNLQTYAAALAYGAVFAIVPMLALLVLLLGIFDATDLVSRAIGQLGAVLPPDVTNLIDTQLTNVATSHDDQAFGFGAVVSALVALWGAMGAMKRVMQALNVVHRTPETRPFVRQNLVALALAVGAIVTLTITVGVIALGGEAAERVFAVVGLDDTAAAVWTILRWPVLLVVAWFGIAAAYRFAPATRQAGGFATPGTLVAVVGWLAFSALFSWYVGGVGSMDATWGSVAGIIVFLLYLQYAGLIVLLGALVDVQLFDRSRPASRLRRWLGHPPTTN